MNLKEHLIKAFEDAENNKSKIDNFVINMNGMSGTKTRHLYNNIANFDDCRYLEIGSYKGITTSAALCNNKMKYFVCVNNLSKFGNNKDEFLNNFYYYKGDNNAYYLDENCFNLDKTIFKEKFNVYLYHGIYAEKSQYDALKYYYENLDDTFIFIVNDWNWQHIRNGIFNIIKYLNLKIIHKIEIREKEENITTYYKEKYYNGLFIAVLQK